MIELSTALPLLLVMCLATWFIGVKLRKSLAREREILRREQLKLERRNNRNLRLIKGDKFDPKK